MMTDENVYAVILAGGSGTRFWPKSRQTVPKQLCRVGSMDKTMLEMTLTRLDGFIPPARRVVVTHQTQATGTEKIAAGLADEIVVEPDGRGTLVALGLAAMQIAARDPQATLISFHSDAIISDVQELQSCLSKALRAAQKKFLVLLGVKADYAESGYDYIVRGDPIKDLTDTYRARFHYRPSLTTIEKFLQTGRHFWNSGIFVWQVEFFLQELVRLQPECHDLLAACLTAGDIDRALLTKNYPLLPAISIDAGVLARSEHTAVIVGDFGWFDVGSWDALAKVFPPDKDGNLAFGDSLMLDCRDTTVETNGPLVATLGLRDMLVIVTADAVLVCPRDRAQEVRRIVKRLPRELR